MDGILYNDTICDPLKYCGGKTGFPLEIDGLIKHFGVSDEVSKQSALLANGNYAEAILILTNNEESISFLNNFQNFMRLTLRFDCGKVLQWIDDNAATGREKQKQFLQYALEVFRDSLMFNYGDKNLVRLTGQEYQFLEKFAPFMNRLLMSLIKIIIISNAMQIRKFFLWI